MNNSYNRILDILLKVNNQFDNKLFIKNEIEKEKKLGADFIKTQYNLITLLKTLKKCDKKNKRMLAHVHTDFYFTFLDYWWQLEHLDQLVVKKLFIKTRKLECKKSRKPKTKRNMHD